MSRSLLDSHPDCRRHIANLIVVGGATRQQIADDLARRYTLAKVPSPRTVTGWLADEGVRDLIRELEGIRRDLQPGENPTTLLPEPPDRAEAVTDLFTLYDDFPAFRDLAQRCELDDDFPDDAAMQALQDSADDTDAEFEARCKELLGDWNVAVALGADPADVARVERARAEGTLEESYDDYVARRKREAAAAA